MLQPNAFLGTALVHAISDLTGGPRSKVDPYGGQFGQRGVGRPLFDVIMSR